MAAWLRGHPRRRPLGLLLLCGAVGAGAFSPGRLSMPAWLASRAAARAAAPPARVLLARETRRAAERQRRPALALRAAAPDDWQQATDAASGNVYYWNAATGETAWTLPGSEPAAAAADSVPAAGGPGLPVEFTGQGTATKVLYRKILAEALAAVAAARSAGKRRLQVEFPLDDSDEGKTLVKRYELMATWAEELAAGINLPRIVRVGEDIQIRDNITPGGGGEYLTNEGIYGYRLSSADQSEQVLLVLLAGVDVDRLNELEDLVKGATSVGRQLPGGIELEVASTGVLSSLDTVGYVREMGVPEDATIILINSGLDKVLAGGGGFFGLGGVSKFLQSFDACYYIKRASTGFLQFDCRDPEWRLWGVPRDAAALQFQVVGTSPAKPPFWEAEQKIKALCRS